MTKILQPQHMCVHRYAKHTSEQEMIEWCWRNGHTHVLEILFSRLGDRTCTRRIDLALQCPYSFAIQFALREDINWSQPLDEEEICFNIFHAMASADVAEQNLYLLLQQDLVSTQGLDRLYRTSCQFRRLNVAHTILRWAQVKQWTPSAAFLALHTPGKWFPRILDLLPQEAITDEFLVQACRMGSESAIRSVSERLEIKRGFMYTKHAWSRVFQNCTQRDLGLWSTIHAVFDIAVKHFGLMMPRWMISCVLTFEQGHMLQYLPDDVIPCPATITTTSRFLAEVASRKGKVYCTTHPMWPCILDRLLSNVRHLYHQPWTRNDALYTLQVACYMHEDLNEIEYKLKENSVHHNDLSIIIDRARVQKEMYTTRSGPFSTLPRELVDCILEI